MKNTINTFLKVTFVLVIFCSATFADGDMNNGGKSCPATGCIAAPATVSGNDAEDSDQKNILDETTTSVSTFLQDCLTQIGIM